mgnify:CR=1 FL=1
MCLAWHDRCGEGGAPVAGGESACEWCKRAAAERAKMLAMADRALDRAGQMLPTAALRLALPPESRLYECDGCRRRVRVALADLDGERHLIACIVGRDDVQAAIVCGGWRDVTGRVS